MNKIPEDYDTVKIIVSGMSGTIHNHIAIIKHAFEEHGINVVVEDAHPYSKTKDEVESEVSLGRVWDKVVIEAAHIPWSS